MNYFNYFSEIEETFARRRGKSLFLGPLDWALMETWKERGIPLHIVIRGIERVFDNLDESKANRTIKSLAYCKEEVEAQYDEWMTSQVGKVDAVEQTDDIAAPFSDQDLTVHLQNLDEGLSRAISLTESKTLAKTLEAAHSKIVQLKAAQLQAEDLERELVKLEDSINASLLTELPTEFVSEARSGIESQLKSYRSQMNDEVYEETYERMLLKKLREKASVPPLSLFFL